MAKKEVSVTFNTITPLWTGDAWQDNSEIRPSSLMGSLRFWFEVICYFSGICKIEKENNRIVNIKEGRFEKEVNKKDFRECILERGNDFQAKIECLNEQNILLPSIIFGTTNWKSLIEIKDIEYLENYCFGNYLNLPYAIAFYKKNNNDEPQEFKTREELNTFINNRYKNIRDWKEKQKKFREEYSVFYFPIPYFYGKFSVTFKIDEIEKSIFFPLLTFMEQYGFWGGKWNIGYGRLEIKSVEENNQEINNWQSKEFDLSVVQKDKKINFTEFIKFENKFENLTKKENKIKVLHPISSNSDFKEIIKILIQRKSLERASFREDDEERHKIFGKTGNPRQIPYVPQGSKILPYIYKEGKEFKGGFISVAGLLNLERIGDRDG
ncbi:type III-B CRISPR module RAMP protein Cmr1 [Deferribacter thermophilus]|uniref:type III-B CRISPR module RAMP protein Cmr1 n=1 Tax=Deferribacter thermophilus TaxID=53573 RepID=UPI003C289FAB